MPKILKNEQLELRIDLPLENYNQTRFDWTGKIVELKYKGLLISTTEKTTANQDEFSGKGFYNEFGIQSALGFEEAQIGEWFHKIGVGLLRKESKAYDFQKAYTLKPAQFEVQETQNSILFTCRSDSYKGYSYFLEKEIKLLKNGFEIKYRLENTGERPIHTNEYNHNFIGLNQDQIGSNYILKFPFQIKADQLGEKVNPENLVVMTQNEVRFKDHPKKAFFFSNLSGDEPVEGQWQLENRKEKIGISETINTKAKLINLWGCGHVVSPELFVDVHIKAGDFKEWSRVYKVHEIS